MQVERKAWFISVNYKMIGRIISNIMIVELVFMIPALLISVYHRELAAIKGFLEAILIGVVAMLLLRKLCGHAKQTFRAKEGLVCVGCSWIALSLIGCLPFWLSGAIPHFMDALFETVSGFTTTGASILTQIEGLPYGILYWRSFSHWLGGMGVLVFLLALVPTMEKGSGASMHILRAESPGPEVGKLVPHIRETAMILYIIYVVLTVLDFMFLMFGGMPLFESVCTALGTAGTGGFGVKNDSIAGYSPYLQNVCTVFMLLFGVNFTCYYLLLLRHFRIAFKNEEVRLYIGIVISSIGLIVWNTWGMYESFEESFRHAAFQVASIITTTGFATTDFDLWPSFSKALLFCLMIVGACAGSTGGGMKCGRVLLLIKSLKQSIKQVQNPNRITVVKVNGVVVQESVLKSTNCYLIAYLMIIVGSFVALSLDGFSITTNLSAVIACFNNIGPGFEIVGPCGNYSAFGDLSKLILIFDMLAGRLEIFPMLVLFSRNK